MRLPSGTAMCRRPEKGMQADSGLARKLAKAASRKCFRAAFSVFSRSQAFGCPSAWCTGATSGPGCCGGGDGIGGGSGSVVTAAEGWASTFDCDNVESVSEVSLQAITIHYDILASMPPMHRACACRRRSLRACSRITTLLRATVISSEHPMYSIPSLVKLAEAVSFPWLR